MEQITIPMEEYKELLMIKGKYEELRRMYEHNKPHIREPINIPTTNWGGKH